MRSASLLRIALLGVATTTSGLAQSYSVSGSLVNSLSGTPVPHGHLSASLEGSTRNRGTATSIDADETGHFVLPLPGAGVWVVMANARGYASAALDEHENFSTGVVVTAAKPSSTIVFGLIPEASIRGVVLDEAGEPVRTAQVSLLRANDRLADQKTGLWQARGSTRTNDLGSYEFPNLAPGRYHVMVQAQPWYAIEARRTSPQTGANSAESTLDSSLDVAYPLTWYPGVVDQEAASLITLDGGERREADLHLLPVPSIHLKFGTAAGEDRRPLQVPQIRLLVPGEGLVYQPVQASFHGRDGLDIAGLAPGSYEISYGGGDGRSSTLQIGTGSPRVLDFSSAIPTATTTVFFDAPEGVTAPAVQFVNVETGHATMLNGDGNLRSGEGLRGDRRFVGTVGAEPAEGGNPGLRHGRDRSSGGRTVDLPAGRYEVRLLGTQGQVLTGMAASGAECEGRIVSIHGGSPQLTLRFLTGHATIEGIANSNGVVVAGAMVMLVPATLGDPQSFAVIRREQSNTDGSFSLQDVIPGRYILFAIDHGWRLDLKNETTLQPYLLHGIPIDLGPKTRQRESLETQTP